MADIFDTSLSEGRSIQQGINEPFINAQSRAAGTEIDAEDQFNLAAGQRVDQIQAQHDAWLKQVKQERAIKAAQKSKMEAEAAADRNLNNLTSGLISRYNAIDMKVTNPIERNRLKREADLVAMQAAGKGSQDYINGFIGKLNTKMEAREDGMVNVLDSKGNIIRIEAGSKDAVLEGRLNKYRQTVDEVLPNTLGSMDSIIQKDAVTGGHIKSQTVSEMLNTFKNESGRMKRISDEYHVGVNTLSSSEIPKLKDKALNGYLSATANMFGTFTSPDMLSAIRSGGLTPSDMEIAMQQVRRDVIDDIAQNKVGIKIADVESFIKTSMDNVRSTYESVAKGDLMPLETAHKQAELRNGLAKEQLRAKMNIPQLEVDKQVADFYIASSAAITGLYDAIEFSDLPPEQIATMKQQAQALVGVSGDMMAIHRDVRTGFNRGSLDLEDFVKATDKLTTRADAVQIFGVLARVTKEKSGVLLAPQVISAVERAAPKVVELLKSGELTEGEVNSMMQQLKRYESTYKDVVKKTGYTESEFLANSQAAYIAPGMPGEGSNLEASQSTISKIWGWIFENSKKTDKAVEEIGAPKRSKERAERGKPKGE